MFVNNRTVVYSSMRMLWRDGVPVAVTRNGGL
jgi:hypothetical protein